MLSGYSLCGLTLLAFGYEVPLECSKPLKRKPADHEPIAKIIQEIQRSQFVVFACGDSSFRFEMFRSLEHDLRTKPDYGFYRDIEIRTPSWYMTMFMSSDLDLDASIWDLFLIYASSHCSDPRDRVFGLLGLAEEASSQSIRPDYSKSHTQVLLQLLEEQAEVWEESAVWARRGDCHEMVDAHYSIGNYGSSADVPEIATMLQQRRLSHHNSRLSPTPMPHDLSCILKSQRRIAINVHAHCTLRRDPAGAWIAPLVWKMPSGKESQLPGHDFRVDRNGSGNAIQLHDPNGSMIALADTSSLPGDVLLFFDDFRPLAPMMVPVAGLIVRRVEGRMHSVVGQFISDYGVRPCPIIRERDYIAGNRDFYHDSSEDAACECGGDEELHGSHAMRWKVYMSPKDLLLFITQDMKIKRRLPGKDVAPITELSMWPEQTAERLATSVTDEPFSSYVVCELLGGEADECSMSDGWGVEGNVARR